MQSAASKKRQRATQACDFCHLRGLRCRPGGYNLMFDVSEHAFSAGCLTCTDYGVECTTNRPFRKRGRKLTHQNTSTRDTVRTSIEVEDLPWIDKAEKCY
jgi:hypothetical protein